MSTGRIGVAVVTYNSADVVGALLDSLPAALDGVAASVVVVDNGSTDATAAVLEARTDCRLVRSANVGFGAGLNLAWRHLDDVDALLVLNPDLTLEPRAVRVLLDRLHADPRTGIVVPQLRDGTGALARSLRREPSLLNAAGLKFLPDPRFSETVTEPDRYAHEGTVDWATGAAMLISARCFTELDGFDESFFLYSEETDLCLRARDAGWATVYTPDAVATHLGAGSGFDIRLHGLQLQNRVRLYRKRHSAPQTLCYHGLVVLAELSWIVRGKSESSQALTMLFDLRRPPAALLVGDHG